MTTYGQQFTTPFGMYVAINEKNRGLMTCKAIDTSLRTKISPTEMSITKYIRAKGNRAFVSVKNIQRGLHFSRGRVRRALRSMRQNAELMHTTAQRWHNYGGRKPVHLYGLPDMYDIKGEDVRNSTKAPFYRTWRRQQAATPSSSPPLSSLSHRCSTALGWSWSKAVRCAVEPPKQKQPALRHASSSFEWFGGEVLALAGGLYSLEVAQCVLGALRRHLESVAVVENVKKALRQALKVCHKAIIDNDHEWLGKGWDGCSVAVIFVRGDRRTVLAVGSVSVCTPTECVRPRDTPTVPCMMDRSVPLQFGFCPCWPLLGMKNVRDDSVGSGTALDFDALPCHESFTSVPLAVAVGHAVPEAAVVAGLAGLALSSATAAELVQELASTSPRPSCIEMSDCVTVLLLPGAVGQDGGDEQDGNEAVETRAKDKHQ